MIFCLLTEWKFLFKRYAVEPNAQSQFCNVSRVSLTCKIYQNSFTAIFLVNYPEKVSHFLYKLFSNENIYYIICQNCEVHIIFVNETFFLNKRTFNDNSPSNNS